MLFQNKSHPVAQPHRDRSCFPAAGKIIIPLLLTGWFSLASAILLADITMPGYFSDGMVLQRNSDIEIWGKANSNQKLTVQFLDQQVSVVADPGGQWSATVKTFQAGGPFELTVVAEGGGPKKVLTDVMVGEVWLCSGQSNMEWPINRSLGTEEAVLSAKDYPNIKFFSVGHDAAPQPLEDFAKVRPWRTCNGDTVADFSAVAFYFGRELSDSLGNIPIGLISSTWGGTPAEAWVSRPGLEQVESLQPLLQHWNDRASNDNQYRPANLYNGMIAPIARAKIRGVIWYQGESNNGRGFQYATLFPTLINDWRKTFSSPELPFLFVQLAPFRYGNRSPQALAEVWDAQLQTFRKLPHTGMVVTTDITDLADIHPGNKLDVGRRLAGFALGTVYRPADPVAAQIPYSGPIFKSYQIDQNSIIIDFDFTGDGLIIQGDGGSLNEFQICGSDGQFVPANAAIRGNQVVVSSPEVPEPVAVRFGWSDTAQPNLFNSIGQTPCLPASPFRTDDFPLESEGINF
jgi:sialate O-acetylesterase